MDSISLSNVLLKTDEKQTKMLNGSNQNSFSLMSSCDSDPEVIKRMPVMEANYNSSYLSPESSNQMARTPSGADILKFGPINSTAHHSPARCHSIEESLRRQSSCCGESDDGKHDVTDSVPSRTGKKKTLFDEKSNITPSISESGDATAPAVDDKSLPKENRALSGCSLCQDVFYSLFSYEYFLTRYNILDLVLNLGSIALYIFDFTTDWLNAFNYLDRQDVEDHMFYFWLTVIFIVVPSLVMHGFSVWWEVEDKQYIKQEKRNRHLNTDLSCGYFTRVSIFHVLQIAPIYRYLRTMKYGLLSRKKEVQGDEERWEFFDNKYKGELLDVNFIRLMESFLEAAPQIVLQIFIMIRTTQTPTITVLSVCVSLFGLSISFVAYQRALRNTLEDKEQITVPGSIVLLLYRSFTNLSRVFALAMLLNISVWAWIIFFIVHWLLMTFFVLFQKTDFCLTKGKEVVYNIVIGFCYNFAFINVKSDRNNRYRMLAYYVLIFLENTTMAVCWLFYRQGGGSVVRTLLGLENPEDEEPNVISTNVALGISLCVILFFILGMAFFFIYYLALHPKASGVECCIGQTSDSNEFTEIAMQELKSPVIELNNCGDSYRTYRKSPQFNSWHSASVNYNPENTPSRNQKRPSSEIISPSASLFYTASRPHGSAYSSAVDVASSSCSCYSMRNNAAGYHEICSRPSHSSLKQLQNKEPQMLSSARRSLRSLPYKVDSGFDSLREAELKRQQVAQLIEQKQKEKKEIERKQALLRFNVEQQQQQRPTLYLKNTAKDSDPMYASRDLKDLFNRKQRAKRLYANRRSFSDCTNVAVASSDDIFQANLGDARVAARLVNPFNANNNGTSPAVGPRGSEGRVLLNSGVIVERPAQANIPPDIIPSLNVPKRLQYSKPLTPQATSQLRPKLRVESGTFPRCTRSTYAAIPAHLKQVSNLNPINENKPALHTSGTRGHHSASLMDLALRDRGLNTVPRAMSFTLTKNEVVESMESSL